jgi:hypothetical protein
MVQRRIGARRSAKSGSWSPEFGVGLLGYGASWCLLWAWIVGMTEGYLVPWDTTPVRPAPGTWQLALNVFFEGPPGSLLPSWVFLTIGVAIFVVRLVRRRDRRWLPWAFAATNLIFMAADLVCGMFAWNLPTLEFLRAEGVSPHLGYEHTWAPLSATLLLLFALFMVQTTLRVERQPLAPDVALLI